MGTNQEKTMSKKGGYYYLKRKCAQQQLTLEKQRAQIITLQQNEEKGWNAAQAYWQHMGWFRRWLWYRKHKS